MKKLLGVVALTAIVMSLLPGVALAGIGTNPFVTTLYAGQHIDVGTVSVWNDGETLYVCYQTEGWHMTETHLAVADTFEGIPQNNGNPIPGQFPYKHEEDEVGAYQDCYEIPMEWASGTELYFGAHAVVCEDQANRGPSEQVCGFEEGVLSTVALLAGQHINAGTVTAAVQEIDGEYYLVVIYATVDGWELNETHLAVAHSLEEIPQKNGNPIPGQFPYKHEDLGGATYDAFYIPFSELVVACDDVLYIAAHAALQHPGFGGGDGDYQTETGWADGPEFPGKNWATYFTVTVPCTCEDPDPEPPACETAWGYGDNFPGKNWATYFTYTVNYSSPVQRPAPIIRRRR